MNLLVMNDQNIRNFLLNAATRTTNKYSEILDCSELLLNDAFSIASEQSAIRYIGKNAISFDKGLF